VKKGGGGGGEEGGSGDAPALRDKQLVSCAVGKVKYTASCVQWQIILAEITFGELESMT
jgi:hypothetical protein